jgi:hypothetical protein
VAQLTRVIKFELLRETSSNARVLPETGTFHASAGCAGSITGALRS